MLIVQHMLSSIEHLSDFDNYLVVDMLQEKQTINRELWNQIIFLDPPVGGSVIGARKRCKDSIKKVGNILKNYDYINLFLSDIQWPLNNALYGKFIKGECKNNRRRIELCNFPDGIVNLYFAYPNFKQKIKNIIKSLFGLVLSSPYYYFNCDIAGLEISNKIYSLMPESISEVKDKIVSIPKLRIVSNYNDINSCIFLGQPYHKLMPAKKYISLMEKAASFTKKLDYEKYYYKAHPSESTKESWNIFKNYGFELINDNRTIEEMFLYNQMGCIVSFNSSALIHLKLLYGNNLRCISCYSSIPLKYVGIKENAYKHLKSIFSLCGVECYE